MNDNLLIRLSTTDDTLRLQVVGRTASGKTTIALALMGVFQRRGYAVTVKDSDLDDPSQNARAPEWQAMRIAGLLEKGREIRIESPFETPHIFARTAKEGLEELGFTVGLPSPPDRIASAFGPPKEVIIDTIQANRDGRAPMASRTV